MIALYTVTFYNLIICLVLGMVVWFNVSSIMKKHKLLRSLNDNNTNPVQVSE